LKPTLREEIPRPLRSPCRKGGTIIGKARDCEKGQLLEGKKGEENRILEKGEEERGVLHYPWKGESPRIKGEKPFPLNREKRKGR